LLPWREGRGNEPRNIGRDLTDAGIEQSIELAS
jgi:hypothetical protein